MLKICRAPRTAAFASLLLCTAVVTGCDDGGDAPAPAPDGPTGPVADGGIDDGAADAEVGVDRSGGASEIAVIVDTPYGEKALAAFPALVDSIDSREEIDLVVHVGDIKSGDSLCSDEWYRQVHRLFMSFDDPFIFTPGDNEWTDCHRPNNGGHDPVERLDALREVFFDDPGVALGGGVKRVRAQANYPENQLWFGSDVAFATVHEVGSNNGLTPRDEGRESPERYARRLAAFEARDAANVAWLQETFALAGREGAAGIALFLHADMWRPAGRLEGDRMDGHQRLVEALAPLAERFGRPVLMLSGDSHDYRVDAPVEWFELYGVPSPDNLTQLVVDRTIENDGTVWLRLSVDARDPAVFRWEEISLP